MKLFLRHIFLITAMLMVVVGDVWGQLPFNTTMTQSHYNSSSTKIASAGDNGWDGGVRLGGTSTSIFAAPAYNYDDKYIVIALSTNGIPNRITCSTTTNSSSATGTDFYIATSPDNKNFTTQKTLSEKNNSFDVQIPKDTRYIKLCYSGNFAGYFKNIVVSNLTYALAPKDKNFDFKEEIIGFVSTPQSTTLEWCDIDPVTCTLSGDSERFEYSISNNAQQDKYGIATISVNYKYDVVGEHSAILKVAAGTNTYEINLSGTTLDKYTANLAWTIANTGTNTGTYHVTDNVPLANIYTLINQTTEQVVSLPVEFSVKTIERSTIYQADGDANNDNDVISIEDGQVIAKNAGKAKIIAKFDGNDSYKPFESELTLTINKYTPEFTWKDTVYFNQAKIEDYFSTSNKDTKISITNQTDRDVADLYFSTTNPSDLHTLDLTTYNKEASTKVTVAQEENWYWYAKSEEHTITPIDPNNHVPFVMNSLSRREALFYQKETSNGEITCSEGGEIKLDQNGGIAVWTANPLYYTIKFTGIPDKLSFDYKQTATSTAIGTTGKAFIVYESADGVTWNQIWTSDGMPGNTDYETKSDIQLNPETHYIKFFFDATYSGYYRNITVTELREFHAVDVNNDKIEVDTLYFGQQYVDNPSVTKKFDLRYANAGYKVTLESTDPQFTVSPTFIDTIGGEKFGKVKNIQVVYNPDKEHNTNATNAKIRLYDECGYKDSIILVANTIKSTPTLRWADKWSATKPVLILNQEVTDAAISNNGYSQIKYRSSNPSAIEIINDGTAFRAISVGDSAVITAYQEADQVYNAPADISKTFKVTDKMMQYIVWNDDLTRLYVDSEPVALTAQVWVMTDAETGTWEYSAEQTAKLKYYSPNNGVVSVSNDTLYVQGIGELMLDAYVEADAIYEEVHTQIPVRVRDHSATCTEEDLIIPLVGMNLSDELQYDPYAIYDNEKIVEIDRSKGIPGNMAFAYRGVKAWGQLSGKIRVFESVDGGSSWSQVLSDAEAVTPTTTTQYSPMIPISRNATHLKFERYDQVKMGYHMIGYITVYPAKFIEAEDIDFGNVYVGNTVSMSKTFSYSSVRGVIDITTSNSHLSTTPKSISKECGAWGSESLTITLNADASIIGEFKQYVEIRDAIGNIVDTIKVSANIVKNSPTITWNPTIDTIRSSADWALQKTALSSAGDEVQYDIVSGNNLYAKLDSYGKMILLHGGVITARAFTPESDRSNEVEQTRQFVIIVDPLFENTANDNDWHNPNNWNIGREPYANDSATILTNQSARITKHVQLVGLKFQLGCGLHVDSLGGLTVGDQGIQGAENDSIVLYNTLLGVGFLRVAPAAKFKPQRVKVFYTTGAYDSGIPRDEKWQYIGAPGSNMQMEDANLTTIYHWNEQQGWLKLPDAGLVPFSGYAFTQKKAEKATFAISANPILTNQEITLTCTPSGMGGSNVFANSFLAPIDLTAFDDDDFEGNVDKAFYLFNSGSWNQWQQQGGSTNTMVHGISPGQYYALSPYGSSFMDPAYDQTTIPPMQGVYVVAREDGAKIKLDYTKHVYNANASNQAMCAPQRHKEDFKRVRLQVNSANSGADRMYVVQYDECTPGYDNGYDAKNMPAEGQVSIYSHEKEGQMEISVTNRIDSTYIGFRAGTDTEYTIHMTSVLGEELYLKDLQDNVLMPIVDGAAYTFSATPKSVNDRRFLLIDKRYESVGGDSDQVDVYVYDRKVYVKQAPAGSKMYIYTIGGLSIASYPIGDTPCIVDLSMLPTGIYLLKINNQAYKFVCK